MSRNKSDPASPAPFDLPDLTAIQAVATGTANPEQQIRALKWIVEQAAGAYEPSFRFGPDGERQTIFCEGRRFVGMQIISMTKINPKIYVKGTL